MTKWARMRKRKERRRTEEASKNSVFAESESKLNEPEKISDNVKHTQTQKVEAPKISKSNPVLSQIPRYIYLVAIFALLSGVFYPLITPIADDTLRFVIGGTATLFLGLAGGILIFKAATSDKAQGILLVVGFALIAISLALIFLFQDWWQLQYV